MKESLLLSHLNCLISLSSSFLLIHSFTQHVIVLMVMVPTDILENINKKSTQSLLSSNLAGRQTLNKKFSESKMDALKMKA